MFSIRTLLSIIHYDLLHSWRRKSEWTQAWLFFILIVSLFPLAVTPDIPLLHTIAPGLIWVAALLSMLLALQQFLKPDYQDGSLYLLLLSPHPLCLLLLAKVIAHWLISGFPLILISPLLAGCLHLSLQETVVLMTSLLIGTPILSLIGAISMALTISLENQSFLLALLVLPLCVPVLVFGTGVVLNAGLRLPTVGILALLGAFLMLALTLTPLAMQAALKVGEI